MIILLSAGMVDRSFDILIIASKVFVCILFLILIIYDLEYSLSPNMANGTYESYLQWKSGGK